MAQGTSTDSEFTPAVARLARLRAALHAFDQRQGLTSAWLIAAFCISCLLLILRSPSMFTHAQFWAEDGHDWYAQAYNSGWLHSLTIPDGGYLNTLQRLAAGLALLTPFRWSPLTMAVAGLVCQALPVPILLSYRCSKWGALSLRIAFAAVYVAIPNAREIYIVCTNSHFHFALIEIFLAFAVAPRSFWSRAFDVVIFLIGGVSGPFAAILAPLLLAFWFVRRQRWSLVQLAVIGAGSVIQLHFLLGFHAARFGRPLGASWSMFARLLGGNVYLGALRGSVAYGMKEPLIISLVALLVGLALCLYCSRFVSLEVRLFFIYCYVVLAASLRSPLVVVSPLSPWMEILQNASTRYWFFPSLPFLFAILWCIWFSRSRVMRWTAIALALVLCQGIRRDWSIPPLVDLHFSKTAAGFENAPQGTVVVIPINPKPWSMQLKKK